MNQLYNNIKPQGLKFFGLHLAIFIDIVIIDIMLESVNNI